MLTSAKNETVKFRDDREIYQCTRKRQGCTRTPPYKKTTCFWQRFAAKSTLSAFGPAPTSFSGHKYRPIEPLRRRELHMNVSRSLTHEPKQARHT